MTQAIVADINDTQIDTILDGKGYILAMYGIFDVGPGFVMTVITEDKLTEMRSMIQNDYIESVNDFDFAIDQIHKGSPTGEFVLGNTYIIVGTEMANLRPAMEAYENGRANLS